MKADNGVVGSAVKDREREMRKRSGQPLWLWWGAGRRWGWLRGGPWVCGLLKEGRSGEAEERETVSWRRGALSSYREKKSKV